MTRVSRLPTGRFRLALHKEDFKFSAAHFTIFGPDDAEPLHGHNYRVEVELEGAALDEWGLLLPVGPVKEAIRSACLELDDRVILPSRSPLIATTRRGDSWRVVFGKREYLLPRSEVLLLELENTTIELFARHLWSRLAPAFVGTSVDSMAVTVEEAAGQSARFEAPLLEAEAPLTRRRGPAARATAGSRAPSTWRGGRAGSRPGRGRG